MKNFTFSLLIFLVGFADLFAQASFSTGQIDVVVNTYGRIRILTTNDQVRHLQRATPLVGVSPTQVWDYQNDADVEVPTALVSNPQLSDFEITGTYNNAYSGAPPDVLVKYNIYGWTGSKYMIFKMTIKNRETAAINAKIGLDIIPEIEQIYGNDTVTYLQTNGIIRFHRGNSRNMGVKLLSHNLHSLYSFEWFSGYTLDTNYWNWLNYGSIQSQYPSGVEGPVTIPSKAFVNINPNDSIAVFYAFAIGASEAEIVAAINEAQVKYNTVLSIENKTSEIPTGYSLEQNFPNPFNPSTKILFSINKTEKVSLKVFDILGNAIATLVNQEMQPGIYEVEFNISNQSDEVQNLSSGIYFYQLNAGSFIETKKMILMK